MKPKVHLRGVFLTGKASCRPRTAPIMVPEYILDVHQQPLSLPTGSAIDLGHQSWAIEKSGAERRQERMSILQPQGLHGR